MFRTSTTPSNAAWFRAMNATRFAVALLASSSFAMSASAAEIYHLNKTAKIGRELTVGGYFRDLRENCETKELPEINLTVPPKGGTVCMRATMTPVRNIWNGKNQHCIGKSVQGIWVIYLSFGNLTGLERMQFTAKVGQAPSLTRTYEAEITVGASEETAVEPDSTPLETQQAGPVPMCPALVS
jgi:hypothetical protein